MSIIVGGSTSGDTRFTTMPISTTSGGGLSIKFNISTSYSASTSLYYSSIAAAGAALRQWSSAELQPIANTLEQVLVDVSGEGVLTNVHTTSNSISAVHTVRVEIDGGEPIVYAAALSANSLLMLGYVSPWYSSSSASSGSSGVGGYQDPGFGSPALTLGTPVQTVLATNYGLKFNSSLRVTIQSSVNQQSSATNKAVALYTTFIPKGI